MKLFLLSTLIINTLCLTKHYYTKCNYGAPKSGLITYSDCQEYASSDSYCCLLYYVSNPDIEFNFYFKKGDTTEKDVKGRKLSERVNLCFGLTSSGYDKILDVIDELEDESGLDKININCFSKNIKFSIIILILLILF